MRSAATSVERFERTPRNSKGATLTEMLIASLLIGFSLAAIGEVMVLTTLSANKLSNRASGISDSRTACSRIQSDVRAARNFGDSYDDPTESSATHQSNFFPCDSNPLYRFDSGPQHTSTLWTWSGWPTTWGSPPYKLDAQTLIIQQPKLLSVDSSSTLSSINGFPLEGTITNGRNNLDTVVYKLIQDPNQAGEFILQRAVFVGEDTVPGASYSSMVNPPQTVVGGIIGPLTNNGSTFPEVFSYWVRNAEKVSSPSPLRKLDLSELESNPGATKYIIGVGMDLELRKPDSRTGNSNAAYQQRMGIHTEAFLRYNKDMSALN